MISLPGSPGARTRGSVSKARGRTSSSKAVSGRTTRRLAMPRRSSTVQERRPTCMTPTWAAWTGRRRLWRRWGILRRRISRSRRTEGSPISRRSGATGISPLWRRRTVRSRSSPRWAASAVSSPSAVRVEEAQNTPATATTITSRARTARSIKRRLPVKTATTASSNRMERGRASFSFIV